MRKQRNSAPVGRDPSSQPGLQVGLEATRQQKMVKEQNVSTSCQKKKKRHEIIFVPAAMLRWIHPRSEAPWWF